MCGIVGRWNLDGSPLDRQELDRFTDSLAHRGPDGRGTYIDPSTSLGLGHRRLAILDPSESSQQPMSYGNERYWITYNGEIYNFIELRAQLEALGHRFCSESDTEVVLASYAEWGDLCQLKFNGEWAFAIWDSQDKTLFLSRDRFSVKPLFYLFDGKHFLFASELKAFMALDTPLKPHFNPGIVANLSNSGSALNTLLVGVCNLHGGHQLIQREGKASDIKQWWRTSEHLVDVPRTFEDQVTQYKSLFFDACRIRMRSDVPIGTSLSGGLDSSSILCTMTKVKSDANSGQRTADKWQLAFMIDYVGTSTSERGFAEKVIKHTGAMPCYKDICSSSVSPDEIVQTIYHLEAIDKLKLGIWNVYKEMRNRDVVVSVDGHGGDETLAGYTRYISVALQDAIWPWKNNRYRDLQDVLRGMGDSNILPSRMKTMMPNARSLKRLVERLLPSNYNRLKTYLNRLQASHDSNWMLALPADSMFLREEQLSGALFDYLNTMLYYDTHNYSLTKYLRDYDRLSMAHGVEIRTPFLDWRLVTYAFSLPSSSKLGAGFTKRILRESMRDVLPETIRIRKSKIGFADPVGGWYAHNLKPFFLDTVHSQDFLQSEVWKGPVIRDFVENCYRKEEFGAIGKCWRYIQAMHLMRSFQQSSTRNRAV